MGGLGSGHHLGHEPRRLVERSFVLDVREVLAWGLVPGTQGDLTLRAPLIAWPLHAQFLVRRLEGPVVTIWFDREIGNGVAHIPIDEPPRGSHRRPLFVCPRPRHPADTPACALRLYWPFGDRAGFACRACHKLAYGSQQTRREEPQWMRRVRTAAAEWAGGRISGEPACDAAATPTSAGTPPQEGV